ncbi:MAG: hypothetical protein LIP23_09230 [Planctomycetes bacterium]|nr:hypothetical protein [Planctomycetota bacterium]
MESEDMVRLYGELQQVNLKIDHLTELFNQAAYGDGFPRCARQDDRIDHVVDSVALCHARVSAMKKWLWAGLVTVVTTLVNYLWERLRSS